MALLKETRYSQAVQEIEFTWLYSDTMANTSGATVDFGASNIASSTFEVLKLPVGAVVVGGHVVTETAFDTAGYDVKIGDSVDDDRYLVSADLKAAALTALLVTGYRVTSATQDIRVNFASDDVCTAGKMTVRILFILPSRAVEVTGSP